MAALAYRKRIQNVRSCRSYSSIVFHENSTETDYISDNSTSDVERASKCQRSDRKYGILCDYSPLSSGCRIVKKHFDLNIKTRKHPYKSEEDYCSSLRKGSKCNSKNALNARKNREKKKELLENLEHKVQNLLKENLLLEEEKIKDCKVIQALKDEVMYLKSVLVNSPEMNNLLKSVCQNTDLPVKSSLNKFTDYQMKSPFAVGLSDDCGLQHNTLTLLSEDLQEQNITDTPLGVDDTCSSLGLCLHVAHGHVSLEFCPMCSNNATVTWKNKTS